MSEGIPTPYDNIIEELEKVTGQEGFDFRQRQIKWWKDMQGAFRGGHLDGVQADRKRRNYEREGITAPDPEAVHIVRDHPGQHMTIPTIVCDIHNICYPAPTKLEAERTAAYMVTGKGGLRMVHVGAPGFKGEYTGRAKLEDELFNECCNRCGRNRQRMGGPIL